VLYYKEKLAQDAPASISSSTSVAHGHVTMWHHWLVAAWRHRFQPNCTWSQQLMTSQTPCLATLKLMTSSVAER